MVPPDSSATPDNELAWPKGYVRLCGYLREAGIKFDEMGPLLLAKVCFQSSHARCSSAGRRALMETYSLALLAMGTPRRAVRAR